MGKKPWSKRDVFSAFVIILVLLAILIFNSYYKITPEGRFTKRSVCYDTDKGQDFYKKGAVVMTNNDGRTLIKEDECNNQSLTEYSCNPSIVESYLSTIYFCKCQDGRCV